MVSTKQIFSQLCHYGFQLRVWVPRWPVHPPAWPQLGLPVRKASVWLSPCLRQKGVGVSSQGGRTTEQLVHFLLEASLPHPRHSRPYPAGLPLHSRLACLSGAPPRPRLGSGSSQRHPPPH